MIKENDSKISLSPITSESDFIKAKEIYLDSFPPAEQRPWEMIISGCDGCLTLTGIYIVEKLVGIITTWKFSHFIYVEHFVVDPTLRGRGIGRTAIGLLRAASAPLPILLEAEPEHLSPQAESRIRFYKHLGFDVIDRSYVQPPYDTYLPPVHLWLMSTDPTLQPGEAALLLHREVYNVKEA